MSVGERYAFGILMMYVLAKVQGCPVDFVWYDIACRWLPYFKKWLHAQSDDDVKARFTSGASQTHSTRLLCYFAKPVLNCRCYLQVMLKDVDAVLPTFHEPMHVGVCRTNFSSKFREGAGTGHGEPCEQLWAMLARLGGRLSRMGIAKKHLWLETNVAQFNQQKDVRAPSAM